VNFSPVLFATEQHDYCEAKRVQRTAFVGSYQERTARGEMGGLVSRLVGFET
jgi:hypothetical protein